MRNDDVWGSKVTISKVNRAFYGMSSPTENGDDVALSCLSPIYFWTVFDKVQKGGGSARKCELRNSRAKPGKRASTRIHTQTRRDVTVATFHRVHSSREKHRETPHVTFSTKICAIILGRFLSPLRILSCTKM